jgi:hypothetical protein
VAGAVDGGRTARVATVTKSAVIYVLLDAEGRRRYIGKSVVPAVRFKVHQSRRLWATSWEALETCDVAIWPERERFWIAHGRMQGWPLENVLDGGNGAPEWYRHTIASRIKMAEAYTQERRDKLAETNRCRVWSSESRAAAERRGRLQMPSPKQREKVAEANRRRVWTQESRAKLTDAGRRRYRNNLEARRRLSENGRNLAWTSEMRAKISASVKSRVPWNKGKHGVQVPWNKGQRKAG